MEPKPRIGAVAECDCCGRPKSFRVPAEAEVGNVLEPSCHQLACQACGGRCRGAFIVTRLDGS